MLDVLIALLPATIAGIVYFGYEAAVICILGVVSAVLTEFIWFILAQKIWKDKSVLKDFARQFDFTSCITGLLLALTLPASISGWYMPVLGSIFAVGVVKMLFGGTGKNIVNPALAGRIFLFISFLTLMTTYPQARFGTVMGNGAPVTGPTQLNHLLHGEATLSPIDLLLGTGVAGCIGETCKIALLVGFLYLIVRKVVKWYLPLLMIASEGLFAVALEGFDFTAFLPSILSGGLMLGSIFMATDYVTTPKSKIGNIVYFIALGLLTAGLRKAAQIEVVSFCILLMNFLVFLIDLIFRVRPFGYKRERKKKGGAM